MPDPRVAKLADLLVNYSLELGPGQLVRIDAATNTNINGCTVTE